MSSQPPPKRPSGITPEELARLTVEFDNEFVIDSFSSLSPEQQVRWDKARNKNTLQ